MNIEEARVLHIHVEHIRDRATGDHFDKIEGMTFKDGLLYKKLSLKSLSTRNVQPTFDELNKFRQSSEIEDGDMSSLSILFANRKKSHFIKGDRVIVVKEDLKNLKGMVEKVEEGTVHMKTNEEGLPKTLSISYKELCKYFEPGNHVTVVSGATEGAAGMVVSIEGHLVNILSDTTKELLRVFADNVVRSCGVTSCVTRDYELHDLVLLDDNGFGVIIRVEGEAFQVLKGVPERPDVAIVRLREIKYKIDRKDFAKDCYKNTISVKDVVKIFYGPCKGKQGPIEHIYRGILFISDRHQLEHGGFICVKSESCMMVGGSRANGDRNDNTIISRFAHLRTPCISDSPMRPSRSGPMIFRGRTSRDPLVGAAVKIRAGNHKGCKGRVIHVQGSTVRVELEALMRVVAVDRNYISDRANCSTSTSLEETPRRGIGNETPIHPFMTPMRDSYATPHHGGMRTPMHDRAWLPCTPMRDSASSAYANHAPSPYLPSSHGAQLLSTPSPA